MRAMSARAAADSVTAPTGRCRFMPHSLRSATKPECISAEIERAWARLARSSGHSRVCGNRSAAYSVMARESPYACGAGNLRASIPFRGETEIGEPAFGGCHLGEQEHVVVRQLEIKN